MNRIRRQLIVPALLALATAFATVPQAQAAPARYQLDPEHISMGFLVDHLGYGKVLGMFRAARGSYSFDEDTATLSDVRIEVDTRSVFTNHAKRDQHLASADFLNANEFPRMTFTATSARKTGERSFEIAGQLELLGRSQPLTLTATWNKSGVSPIDKTYVMGVSARGAFKRSSYGMNYGVGNGWVGDEVPLIIEFEAKRQ
ncbi:YceI family protein [Variovorax sp. OV329]|uniref:YceI family protein n=1 Tax=Variovorax sp. OV329 TaxID=1882825 RepID=UPI0008E60B88|nr:YceI family protein [Variovorax sp. OV329]SFN03879.1 Polyisoprenoid-binding protein YceI [Variovorax sp. OV329]